MTNRTWGIEIEYVGTSREAVAAAIMAKGVNCHVESYNHTTHHGWWKVVTDASVRDNRSTGLSGELVSPPLCGAEGQAQLEKVCEALREVGARVNRTCGLHVHHDAGDFTANTFKSLYSLYIRFEDALDTLMPESRRNDNNQFCMGFKRRQQWYLDQVRQARTVRDMESIFSSRYHKLNIQAYRRHSTIEFRHHSGSVDFDKIWNWIVLTQTMVETAVAGSITIPANAERMSQKWFDFRKVIKGYKWMGASEQLQTTIEFYNKRRKSLAKEMGIELAA